MNQSPDSTQRLPGERPDDGQSATGAVGIAAELRQDVLRGDYDFTQRLPSERALAVRFGASRGTIRAALQQLQSMNLVTSRQGSGTYVTYHEDEDDIQSVVQVTSPLELIECRLAIEPRLARLAVLNAGSAALDRMQEALEHTEATVDGPDRFSEADEQFHLALAECAGNPLLRWIYRRINDIRHQTQWSARKHTVLTPQHISEYNQQHRELFTAIRARDTKRAVQAITTHLETARQQLLGVDEKS